MRRRDFIKTGSALAGYSLLGCGNKNSLSESSFSSSMDALDKLPNILFLCTDQFNPKCSGFAGHPLVRTPNLDRLAASGTVFTNCYSNSPVCVPARASMFTGFYPHEVGAYDNAAPLRPEIPTWTDTLRDSGYRCRATGKLDFWHNSDYGMEEVHTLHGHDTSPDVTAYFRKPMVPRIDSRQQIEAFMAEEVNHDRVFVDEAVRFIRDDAPKMDEPWVQYVGLTSPHPKWVVPEEIYKTYNLDEIDLPYPEVGWPPKLHPVLQEVNHYNKFDTAPFESKRIQRARAAYYSMITMLDAWVGLIMHTLEQSGQADNTCIVFTADHGEMLGCHGMWFKSVAYDEAARVPLVISGPGIKGGGTVEAPVSHVDVVDTVLCMAGRKSYRGLRGRSVLPLIDGSESGSDRFSYSELNNEGNVTGSFWIRKDNWKYIYYADGYPAILFDMENDPCEQNNLAGNNKYAEVVKKLDSVLRDTVDPDLVSAQAFEDQARRRDRTLAGIGQPDVYNGFAKRYGEEFAARLKG